MVEIDAQVKNKISMLKKKLNEKMKINKIFIFGSYAKGTNTADSDIDICIIADNITNSFAGTVEAAALAALIDPKIEPLVFSKVDFFEEPSFGIIKEIKATAIEA